MSSPIGPTVHVAGPNSGEPTTPDAGAGVSTIRNAWWAWQYFIAVPITSVGAAASRNTTSGMHMRLKTFGAIWSSAGAGASTSLEAPSCVISASSSAVT